MSDSSDQPADGGGRGTATPFIAALVIVVVLLVGIVVSSWFSSDETLSDADRVSRVTADFVLVHNNDDEEAREKIVCPAYDEDRSPLADRDGDVTLDAVEDITFDGDRATAQVRVTADGGDSTGTWQYARSGDMWRGCN